MIAPQRVKHPVRQNVTRVGERQAAGLELLPSDLDSGRVDGLDDRGSDLRADAVSWDQRDGVFHRCDSVLTFSVAGVCAAMRGSVRLRPGKAPCGRKRRPGVRRCRPEARATLSPFVRTRTIGAKHWGLFGTQLTAGLSCPWRLEFGILQSSENVRLSVLFLVSRND